MPLLPLLMVGGIAGLSFTKDIVQETGNTVDKSSNLAMVLLAGGALYIAYRMVK